MSPDSNNILVLTNTELGWDCVCGVFESEKKLLEYFSENTERKVNSIEDIQKTEYHVHKLPLTRG